MTDNKQQEAMELVQRLREQAEFLFGFARRAECESFNGNLIKEAADMIEAISSQQPVPKEEEAQGEPNGYELFYKTDGEKCWSVHLTRADAMRHLESVNGPASATITPLFTCRPVIDDAAVERALKAYLGGDASKDNKPIMMNWMRAALLAAFPQESK